MLPLPKTVGPFTLLRREGTDRFTENYLGRADARGGVPVRVRRLLPPALSGSDDIERLDQRIRDLIAVQTPEITSVLDWVSDGSERYVVEEDAGGTDLERLLARCRTTGTRPAPQVFLHLAVQLCTALDRLHATPGSASGSPSVLHLALQPSSIRIGVGGGVRLGAAGLVPGAARLVAPEAMGRVEYLAPEQTHPGQELSPATDIFSLGVLLYELMTGRSLFRAASPLATIDRIRRPEISSDLAAVRGLLPGLDLVLFRALALNPRHRYQRAFVLREDLRGLMAGYDFQRVVEEIQRFVSGTGAMSEAEDAEETFIRGAIVFPDGAEGGPTDEPDLELDADPLPRPTTLAIPELPPAELEPPALHPDEEEVTAAIGETPPSARTGTPPEAHASLPSPSLETGPERPSGLPGADQTAPATVLPAPVAKSAPTPRPAPAPVPALVPASVPVPAAPRETDATQAPDPRRLRPSVPHIAPPPVAPPPEPVAPPAPLPQKPAPLPEAARPLPLPRAAAVRAPAPDSPRAWRAAALFGILTVGGLAWWAAARTGDPPAGGEVHAHVGAAPARARRDPRLPAAAGPSPQPPSPTVEAAPSAAQPHASAEAAATLATPPAPLVVPPLASQQDLSAELVAVPSTRTRQAGKRPSPPSSGRATPGGTSSDDLEAQDGATDTGTPPAPLDLDRLAAAAAAGTMRAGDATRLEALPAGDPRYLRALTLVLMDARSRGDRADAVRLLGRIFERPEAHYSPVLLVERARYAVNGGDYRTGLDAARSAEQHWARLPPTLVFSKTAEIYELQAAAAQGLFYRSAGDLTLLVHATTAWERYRDHVASRDRSDLIARADAELARLEDIRRRTR